MTLAASNWDRPDSFVGFGLRLSRLFCGRRCAMAPIPKFALGTVSRRPGLYLAERVGPADRPLGVVASRSSSTVSNANRRDAEERGCL